MSAATIIPAQHRRAKETAPAHPPCFDSQPEWVEYVAWAMASNDSAVRPLVDYRSRDANVLGGFNPAFDFCSDCTTCHRAAMREAGRCEPDWLVQLVKEVA